MGSMAAFFIDGGVWMIPIAFVSLVTLAIAIERIYYIYFVYNVNAATLMASVGKSLQSGNVEQAISACKQRPKAVLPIVMREALEASSSGEDEVQKRIEEKTLEVVPLVQRRGNVLAGLASLATLLGLLGTIMGLITAFMVVADAPDDQKSVLLTKAISIAMNTTAFGLMVAIPALFVHLMVSNTSKKILEELEAYSVKIENMLFSGKR